MLHLGGQLLRRLAVACPRDTHNRAARLLSAPLCLKQLQRLAQAHPNQEVADEVVHQLRPPADFPNFQLLLGCRLGLASTGLQAAQEVLQASALRRKQSVQAGHTEGRQ